MRSRYEGVVASLMLIGIDLAFSFSILTPGKGHFKLFLERNDLRDEWSFMFMAAAIAVAVGLVFHKTYLRVFGLKINAVVTAGTYAVLLILKDGQVLTSAFANVLLIVFVASCALLWLAEREPVNRKENRRVEFH